MILGAGFRSTASESLGICVVQFRMHVQFTSLRGLHSAGAVRRGAALKRHGSTQPCAPCAWRVECCRELQSVRAWTRRFGACAG